MKSFFTTLTLFFVANLAYGDLLITELSTKSAMDPEDYFEITNVGATAVDITGWKFDDESADINEAADLLGITSIGAGESVIFIQLDTDDAAADFPRVLGWSGGCASRFPRWCRPGQRRRNQHL